MCYRLSDKDAYYTSFNFDEVESKQRERLKIAYFIINNLFLSVYSASALNYHSIRSIWGIVEFLIHSNLTIKAYKGYNFTICQFW